MPKVAPPQEDSSEKAADSSAFIASALGWLVPGAGHFYLKRRRRASLFFLLVMTSIILGARLDGKLYMTFDRLLDTFATVASFGSGLAYLVLRFVLGHTGDVSAAGYEYGGAFLLTAGLMNLLLVIDCWDIARGRKV